VAETSAALAKKLLAILRKDRDEHLLKIDDYLHGRHDDPYMPATADDEYKLLAKRAVSNWMPLIVSTPAQALYVDSFRRGNGASATTGAKSSSKHWQRSRLDARQHAVHRGALGYGHSFTVTEKTKRGVITRGLSALRTAAVYEDAANDIVPAAAFTVTSWPDGDKVGKATLWDSRRVYECTFKNGAEKVTVGAGKLHGSEECPVTRFAAGVDLEGRTVGVVEPAMVLNDRINQTIFDLLVAQTYGSFKVRYATGMAPPLKMEPVYADDSLAPEDPDNEIIGWKPKIDPDTGQPIPQNIDVNAKRFLFAEDENVRFGSLEETPLDGYISSIETGVKHLSALTQTPPHYLLGQIANLSAEALDAAETSLSRKVEEFKSGFGESWERVDRLAAELEGDIARAEDFEGEVVWRDMESRSLAQAADALGKLRQQLEIPKKGLWRRVPNVTQAELDDWSDLADNETPADKLATALTRSAPPQPSAAVTE